MNDAFTDKSEYLLSLYEPFLAPRRSHARAVLELGVGRGGSLALWRRQFPSALIIGLDDVAADWDSPDGRIVVRRCLQQDVTTLDRLARQFAPEGFDFIVDDASHIGEHAQASFSCLFEGHLRESGVYAVEDWGTGYWAQWPDGEAFDTRGGPWRDPAGHQAGMVGFVKRLIDEVGALDRSRTGASLAATEPSVVAELHVFPGLVLAVKAGRLQSWPQAQGAGG